MTEKSKIRSRNRFENDKFVGNALREHFDTR
jgi:hypothetical protein